MLKFKLEKTDKLSKARAGEIETAHGKIQTPIFMPVGTVGTVKAVHQHELKDDIKSQIILGNTYHLYLRPGTKVLEKAGGLHKFMNCNGPITPEYAMDIQRSIGGDIIMAFDECTPYPCDYNYARRSMEMTHRWLKRCISRVDETSGLYDYHQSLFPIVQGSTYKDLRLKSAEFIAEQNREGNAIGGLSVGEPDDEMYRISELVCDILPSEKPRYLMGVGTPWNILEAIDLGVDMFDCVMPTRNGRNGMVFTSQGVINIKNKQWASDFSPLDPGIPNEMSQYYTKAYMRHLFMADEILGLQLASIQNLSFYLWLVGQAREHIIAGDYTSWKKTMVAQISKRL